VVILERRQPRAAGAYHLVEPVSAPTRAEQGAFLIVVVVVALVMLAAALAPH
jgi:hypothetical protein